MEKRGQVTLFIIIGLIIVVGAILLYLFLPGLRGTGGFDSKNPNAFLQDCVEEKVVEVVEVLGKQGGSYEPEFYFMYMDEKLEYLCYNSEYYKTCVMQQPMLKDHVESEIKNQIIQVVDECLDALEESYKDQGYSVQLNKGGFDISLLPKKILLVFNSTLVATKSETERFDSFAVAVESDIYELISIANSILNFEARYGDSETTMYMDYYHDLKVEKKKQSDGTKVYILTNRDTEDKFQFATRSLAWPPGYGASGVYT